MFCLHSFINCHPLWERDVIRLGMSRYCTPPITVLQSRNTPTLLFSSVSSVFNEKKSIFILFIFIFKTTQMSCNAFVAYLDTFFVVICLWYHCICLPQAFFFAPLDVLQIHTKQSVSVPSLPHPLRGPSKFKPQNLPLKPFASQSRRNRTLKILLKCIGLRGRGPLISGKD